jgi:hypothetical protein
VSHASSPTRATCWQRAGGPTADAATGPRRDLEIIAGVEHVSILFSPAMYDQASAWFADSLQLATTTPADGGVALLGWWALHLVAVLALWRAVVPVLAERGAPAQPTGRGVLGPSWARWRRPRPWRSSRLRST